MTYHYSLQGKRVEDPQCVECKESLPIGVAWNRKYCVKCQRERIKKYRKNQYQTKLKKARKPNKHTCMVCAVEFEYVQKQNVSWKVCPTCVGQFYVNLDKLRCLLCGRKLDVFKREKLVFCSPSCAHISWYLRRRRNKMQSLLNSTQSEHKR